MAAYPDIPLSRESRRIIINGTVVDQADDGTPWVRDFYSNTVYRFDLIHTLISSADAQAIEDVYAASRIEGIAFTYPKDLILYTCYFVSAPSIDRERGDLWGARASLIGTKA